MIYNISKKSEINKLYIIILCIMYIVYGEIFTQPKNSTFGMIMDLMIIVHICVGFSYYT